MLLKKIVCSFLVLVFSFSSFAMIGAKSASAASVQVSPSQTESAVIKAELEDEKKATTNGAKGYLAKLAIQLIKTAIDKGGDVLKYIIKWFDDDTAKYFNQNKSKIVKALDELEDWVEEATAITQNVIKTKLNSLLIAAGVPATYSLPIADAIARTITWLLI